MSRRSQSHRRRTYGRRQHEVRERRPDAREATGWLAGTEIDADSDWQATEPGDDRPAFESFGSFGR